MITIKHMKSRIQSQYSINNWVNS